MHKFNISFAGAGRVADALCRELYRAGFRIDKVVSETDRNGLLLANACGAEWSKDLVFPASTHLIIVAVPDQKLESVLKNIKCKQGTIIAHTAGSIGLDVFPSGMKQKGVFYPLQTFTLGRKLNFNDLPFLIESSDDETSGLLKSIGDSISNKVFFVDTDHRKMLHLAAVFVCNFTNHLFTEGKQITSKAGYHFDILGPLINETISKAVTIGPENSQTGPAIRNDNITIKKHLELLSFSPELQRLYEEITQSIVKYYKRG